MSDWLTLAFKINALNTLKVQNACTEVLYDLKSTMLSLYRNMHALEVHLNTV